MSTSSKTVWIVSGLTESGDSWLMAFGTKPTNSMILLQIDADEWLSEEYEAGCIQGWDIVERVIYE